MMVKANLSIKAAGLCKEGIARTNITAAEEQGNCIRLWTNRKNIMSKLKAHGADPDSRVGSSR